LGLKNKKESVRKTSCWNLSEILTAIGRPVGRPPTVENMTVGGLRSTARSTQFSREHCRVLGRPGRSADTHMHRLCASVDRTVDRMLSVLKNQNCQNPENLVFGY